MLLESFAPLGEEAKKLYLKIPSIEDESWEKIQEILEAHPGDVPVGVYFTKEKKGYQCNQMPVEIDPFLLAKLRDLLGEEHVVVS